jgi:hypothetical protein
MVSKKERGSVLKRSVASCSPKFKENVGTLNGLPLMSASVKRIPLIVWVSLSKIPKKLIPCREKLIPKDQFFSLRDVGVVQRVSSKTVETASDGVSLSVVASDGKTLFCKILSITCASVESSVCMLVISLSAWVSLSSEVVI